MDYNKTICLPKTDFPMRAGLPKREPEMLKRWETEDLYHELLKKNEGKPPPSYLGLLSEYFRLLRQQRRQGVKNFLRVLATGQLLGHSPQVRVSVLLLLQGHTVLPPSALAAR